MNAIRVPMMWGHLLWPCAFAWAMTAIPVLGQSGSAPAPPAAATSMPASVPAQEPLKQRRPALLPVDWRIVDEPPVDGMSRSPDQLLLALLAEEGNLLEDFGRDHPRVCAVRARIRAVREYIERHPPAPLPASVPPSPPQVIVQPPVPTIIQITNTPPAPPSPPPPAVPSEVADCACRGSSGGWFPGPEQSTAVAEVKPRLLPPEIEHSALPLEPAPGRAAPVQTTDAREKTSESPSMLALVAPWVGVLAALLLGMCFQSATLVIILRRFGNQQKAPLPIEVLSSREVVEVPAEFDRAATAAASSPADVRQQPEPPSAANAPEQMPRSILEKRAEDRKQQEEAVFRQIFDQNVQLHEQLCKLAEASA